MSGGLDVDYERLASEAAGFDVTGDGLVEARAKLSGTLCAAGQPWGDDETGQEFAKNYLPQVDQVMKALDSVAKALHDIKSQLVTQAQQYEQTETGIKENLDQAGSGL